jgi:epoxyqueuosine reductase
MPTSALSDAVPASVATTDVTHVVLKQRARELGFDLCGIAPAVVPGSLASLHDWLGRGFAGEMTYLDRRREAYGDPASVLAEVRSVVMLGFNYNTGAPSEPSAHEGRVARYAQGSRDYHDVLRERLRLLADALHELRPGCRTRGVVDTAPLLERDFARLAGLGWFGKNTMLIHKRLGSWFFLAALLTDAELPPDAPHHTSHCGTCTRCLEACPTNAFPEPYVLDATRCISYLTIELRDRPIPADLRAGVGDWLFGCDICNDVCPWNRKAPVSKEDWLQPRNSLAPADCVQLLRLTEAEFNTLFAATPLARPGYTGILRNAAIVLGNSGDSALVPELEAIKSRVPPVVADAIDWAVEQLTARTRESAATP